VPLANSGQDDQSKTKRLRMRCGVARTDSSVPSPLVKKEPPVLKEENQGFFVFQINDGL
jgi:hypothetical protein